MNRSPSGTPTDRPPAVTPSERSSASSASEGAVAAAAASMRTAICRAVSYTPTRTALRTSASLARPLSVSRVARAIALLGEARRTRFVSPERRDDAAGLQNLKARLDLMLDDGDVIMDALVELPTETSHAFVGSTPDCIEVVEE